MLDLKDVHLDFGGVAALSGVSFAAERGQITGLIGPNGAGKTSLFNCVTRIYQPTSGSITHNGKDLLRVATHRIVAEGVGRTYQNLALFPTLSVRENIIVGAHHRARAGYVRSLLRGPGVRRAERDTEALADDLIEALSLEDVQDSKAEGLPFGTLKRVELARALASRPTTLLLDEPAGGLIRSEVHELGELILEIRDRYSLTILMVEHHLGLVAQICDHLVAMSSGRVIAAGDPTTVRTDPRVVESYVGAA